MIASEDVKKSSHKVIKGRAEIPDEEKKVAREALAYRIWRLRFIDGQSFFQIAEAEGMSVGWAFEMVQEGTKLVGRWRAAQNQEADFAIALARLDFMWFTSKPKFEAGNAKHGNILAKVANMHHEICGLKKFEVRHTNILQAPEVLERVKQVQGRVISPLVAEIMPAAPKLQEAA